MSNKKSILLMLIIGIIGLNENYLVVPLYSNPFAVVVNFNWDFYKKNDRTAALNDSAAVENINTGWQDITEQRNHN